MPHLTVATAADDFQRLIRAVTDISLRAGQLSTVAGDFRKLLWPVTDIYSMFHFLILASALGQTTNAVERLAADDARPLAAFEDLVHRVNGISPMPNEPGRSAGPRHWRDSTALRSPVEDQEYRPTPRATTLHGRTPMSAAEARLHLELAYRVVVLAEPQPRILNLLLAQWALETARGQSMWGYNFGGLKASSQGIMLCTRESYGANERRQLQPFRAYATASLGARDYIQTLSTDFPRAFSELQSGVADRFAQALASEGYFTGNANDYRRSIVLLANEYERKWSSEKLGA